MSKETLQWLNTQTLQGFANVRGEAWHLDPEYQGDESNHYPEAIPAEDVRRRLFNWKPLEGDVSSTVLSSTGVTTVTDPTRKAIVRPAGTFGEQDKGAILGLFKQGYRVHNYDEWLITNLEAILDSGLSIGSAGLLKGGAVAWVQAELPDTIVTPEGVAHRPFISAITSMDGSLASDYMTGTRVIVCDNTLSEALGEKAARHFKVKHTSKSLTRVGEIRTQLGLVHQVAEDFNAKVAALSAVNVTPSAWNTFLSQPEIAGVPSDASKATITRAANKRDALNRLYATDYRAAPWIGTAYGVLTTVNTWETWEQSVRGASRAERNADRMVRGTFADNDAKTLDVLQRVLANA